MIEKNSSFNSLIGYDAIFSKHSFQDFVDAQKNLLPVFIKKADCLFLPDIPIEVICEKIRYSRFLVNNLSMSRDEFPIDKLSYSDGVFIDPERVFSQFENNASIIIRSAHRYFRELENFMHILQSPWRCEAQANLYLSKGDVSATYPHFDPHELFIFQLHGSKRWVLYESLYISPEVTDGYDSERHGHGRVSGEYILEEGDMLFLPRGTVHQPVAISSSIHVSIGLKPLSYTQVISQLLHVLAELDPGFRSVAVDLDSPEVILKCGMLLKRMIDFTERPDDFAKFSESLRIDLFPSKGDIAHNFLHR